MKAHPDQSTISASVSGFPESLTKRELEVLRFVSRAMSNYEIAKTLVIEESTVKSHMNRILGKLQAKNRFQAVEKAHALGLL